MLSKSRDDREAEELRILEERLAQEGQALRAIPSRPNEQAFLAQLYETPQTSRHGFGFLPQQLRSLNVATRSFFIGGAVFLGIAAGAASAFVGDPLNLQALPLVKIGSSSEGERPPISEESPQLLPIISPANEAGQDDAPARQNNENTGNDGENNGAGNGQDETPPGQSGDNPGNGVENGNSQDGATPSQGGENPGNGGGNGNGQDEMPPGQGGENPGQGGGVGPDGTPPGLGGENPGNGGGNGNGNGEGGTPPGQDDENPGNGNGQNNGGNGNGNGSGNQE
jgi:hypothetical protein